MTKVSETQLPGVGVRHDFMTRDGDRIGVISHRTGRRDLLIYDKDDPDSCAVVMPLDDDDTHTLTEMLGGSHVSEALTRLQQSVGGLTIDWVPVRESWACAGHTIKETDVRAKTGVSIVAIVRGEETIPSPGADFALQSGDVAVVVGTPDGIEKTFELMQGK